MRTKRLFYLAKLVTIVLFMVLSFLGLSHLESQFSVIWRYDLRGGPVHGISISPGGNYIIAGAGDKIYLFDRSGDLLWNRDIVSVLGLRKGEGVILSVSVSSNGSYIAAAIGITKRNGYVYLLNGSGDILWKYKIGLDALSVSVSSNGSYIAAGSAGCEIYLFDRSGRLLWKQNIEDRVESVSVSSNGSYIVAGTYRGEIYLFDRSGRLLWSKRIQEPIWWTPNVEGVSISSEGDYIAVISGNNRTYVFDRSGKLIWSWNVGAQLSSLSMSSEGSFIALGTYDSNVYFISLPPPIQLPALTFGGIDYVFRGCLLIALVITIALIIKRRKSAILPQGE
ncbi:TPA: hypothetical protein EYP70_00245 [Candidatus Bathyarchaeota archaeon]|nr:hypothetical protein [Candidatus Bathyarchaeota archaeon]